MKDIRITPAVHAANLEVARRVTRALGNTLQREAEASVALDNDPDCRTYSLETCVHCGVAGSAGVQVIFGSEGEDGIVSWQHVAPHGCAAPSLLGMRPGCYVSVDLSAAPPLSGAALDMAAAARVLNVSSQAELDRLVGVGRVTFPKAQPAAIIAAPLRVMGIDPGLKALAIFVMDLSADGIQVVARETFSNGPEHGDTDQRLTRCAVRLQNWLSIHLPRVLGYEALRGVTTGKEQAGKGNADRGPLLEVCGMIRMLAIERGITCYRSATSTARVAVMGKGNTRGSTKQDVAAAVRRLTGVKRITLDQADAGAQAFAAYARWAKENKR